MSAWNDFVKKIYWEGKDKNPNYKFKDALKDASRRKSEMGSGVSASSGKKSKRSRTRTRTGGKRRSSGTRKRKY